MLSSHRRHTNTMQTAHANVTITYLLCMCAYQLSHARRVRGYKWLRTFLVEGDKHLGERLTDGVRLADVAAALDSHADVQLTVLVAAQQDDGLERLVAQDVVLDELERAACRCVQVDACLLEAGWSAELAQDGSAKALWRPLLRLCIRYLRYVRLRRVHSAARMGLTAHARSCTDLRMQARCRCWARCSIASRLPIIAIRRWLV